jgi:lipopolysaccharide export system protein LptA
MKNPFVSLILSLALCATAGLAWAEKADRNKPMNIEADTLRYDDVKQVSVFTGRVVLTKGTIVIRGAQIEVRQDPEGYQYGTVKGSAETPAFFRQKREGLEEFMEGEAETIEYDGKADTVKFIKKAQLRRLRGSTLADDVSGALIVYENLTERFTVDGAAPAAGTATGRVRAMLTPKPESTTAAAPTLPAATLKASPKLEGLPQ